MNLCFSRSKLCCLSLPVVIGHMMSPCQLLFFVGDEGPCWSHHLLQGEDDGWCKSMGFYPMKKYVHSPNIDESDVRENGGPVRLHNDIICQVSQGHLLEPHRLYGCGEMLKPACWNMSVPVAHLMPPEGRVFSPIREKHPSQDTGDMGGPLVCVYFR